MGYTPIFTALLDPIISATSTTAWQGSRGLSEGGVPVGALLDPIIAATSTTAWQGSRGLGPQ